MFTTHSDGQPTPGGIARVTRRHEAKVKAGDKKPTIYDSHRKAAHEASIAANIAGETEKSKKHGAAKKKHELAAKHAPTMKLASLHTQIALEHAKSEHVTSTEYKDAAEKQRKAEQTVHEETAKDVATGGHVEKLKAEAKVAKAKADHAEGQAQLKQAKATSDKTADSLPGSD